MLLERRSYKPHKRQPYSALLWNWLLSAVMDGNTNHISKQQIQIFKEHTREALTFLYPSYLLFSEKNFPDSPISQCFITVQVSMVTVLCWNQLYSKEAQGVFLYSLISRFIR